MIVDVLSFKIYINNGISQDDNAFEFCTRVDRIQLPKSGYLGVTAATGGLADDHDVLEFITNTYSEKQVSAQNQAASEAETKKYTEEFQKYEQELKQQQAEFVHFQSFYANIFFFFSDIDKHIQMQQLLLMIKNWYRFPWKIFCILSMIYF